jgi:hypothetical protein
MVKVNILYCNTTKSLLSPEIAALPGKKLLKYRVLE